MDVTGVNNGAAPANGGAEREIAVRLCAADVALVIDALLQAEMTLPMIDRRHQAFRTVESLRRRQLSLADRLEDVMAAARQPDIPPAGNRQWAEE